MENTELIKVTDKVRELIAESPSAPPGRLSEILVELSSLNSTLSEELNDILIFKPEKMLELKEAHKTIKEAEWNWDASKEGKKETWLKSWLLRIKENKSAIKTRLQIIHDESFGQY